MTKKICAWCKKDLGEAQNSPSIITHGICLECADKLLRDVKIPFDDFLDSLNTPVLVIDNEGVVVMANKVAREMVGKELENIQGLRGGQVVECIYSESSCNSSRITNSESYITSKAIFRNSCDF